MGKWYLIGNNTKPNMTSGFESDAFNDFRNDAFSESLDSDIGTNVTLYNYDLSESQKIRCIIQGNTADTQLKSLERTLLFPIGTVKAGMYVFFEENYWIVTGYPGNNRIYEKVTVILCQYLLRWQNNTGKIIERWANLTSAAKYDVGETGNKTIVLTTNNFAIIIPNDAESIQVEGKRVFIDQNTVTPKKVFKITRNDDSLFNYGKHGGVLSLIADKTEFNDVTDNQKLMLCDYRSPTPSPDQPSNPEQNPILCKIECISPTVKIGSRFKTFKGNVTDMDGNPVSDTGVFSIVSTFNDRIITDDSVSNQLKVKVPSDCASLAWKTFDLIFTVGTVSGKLTITIEE